MIEIRQLSKRYKRNEWALQDLSLTIQGGMFGLLGPNGAGKTTLIRILAALLKPSAGSFAIRGETEPEQIRRCIGYLPQFFQLYPQLTGAEFLDYVAVMKGIRSGSERKKQIAELLEQVNLTAKAKNKIKTYSGGMKQRLGIAQALLGSPEVLIVDEPTTGLDPEERVRFRNLIGQFSLGRTVILSTHIVADIESSCQHVAVLRQGRLAMNGTLEELQQTGSGRVWELELTDRDFGSLSGQQIVSTRKTAGGLHCRVISDHRPHEEALPASPTLEDGYLALLAGDRAGGAQRE